MGAGRADGRAQRHVHDRAAPHGTRTPGADLTLGAALVKECRHGVEHGVDRKRRVGALLGPQRLGRRERALLVRAAAALAAPAAGLGRLGGRRCRVLDAVAGIVLALAALAALAVVAVAIACAPAGLQAQRAAQAPSRGSAQLCRCLPSACNHHAPPSPPPPPHLCGRGRW
jgi:hypothetical protein